MWLWWATLALAQPPPAVEAARIATEGQPMAARIEAISTPLLGAPYALDPLGEGEGIDDDPLERWDRFDCLTFVEQVLVEAYASPVLPAETVLSELRYGGAPPSYDNRNHFMELQWIPNAIRRGYLLDITDHFGRTTDLTLTVDDALWAQYGRRAPWKGSPEARPQGEMHLQVLPLPLAQALADAIPAGTLLLVVRQPKPNTPVWVTHLGFVLDGPHKTLRHASRMKSVMAVTDTPLARYLRYLDTWTRWPVLGVSLLAPLEPPGPSPSP